jgi:hypothetical protein
MPVVVMTAMRMVVMAIITMLVFMAVVMMVVVVVAVVMRHRVLLGEGFTTSAIAGQSKGEPLRPLEKLGLVGADLF